MHTAKQAGLLPTTSHSEMGRFSPILLQLLSYLDLETQMEWKETKKYLVRLRNSFPYHHQLALHGHIDGIGFVVQASQARLTQAQNYIFKSILAIFGKDIGGNIFMMTTFADGGRACVLDSIREAKIPFVESFKFNNSALYEKSDDSAFDKLFWEMGIKSFQSALRCFQTVTPVRLQLTKEFLREREGLELVMQNALKQIQIATDKIVELEQEQHIMKQHEQDIDANKNFTYELETHKIKKIDFERGSYAINCANCNYTCHYPCGIASDSGIIDCAAIANGQCMSCPRKCHWSSHYRNGYFLVTRKVKENRTYDDLKERYDQAKNGKSAKENIIKKMEEELHELHAAVLMMVRDAKQSLNRLKEIAHTPDPLTEIQYIDILIESEKHKGGPGSLNRIKCLEKIRDQAQLMMSIELKEQQLQNYGGTQWWDVLRKT